MVPVHKILFPVAALTLLAACDTSLSIFYKQGASVARMQTDQTRCEVSALRDAPVATQVRQSPPTYVPGRRVCNSQGQCRVTNGYYIPGNTYTVDVNAGLRERVLNQCMADIGYTPVSIPACPQNVRSAVSPRQTQTLPPVNEASCAVKYDDGSWQIVSTTVE